MCSGRKHTWATNPPVAGTRCTKCPKVFQASPQKEKAPAAAAGGWAPVGGNPPAAAAAGMSAAAASAAPRVNALAAALARVQPAAAPPAAAEPPEPPPEGRGWTKFAGPRLAGVFVAVTGAALERAKRRPNEPSDESVDEFGDALAAQLTVWFPDSTLSPGKRCLIAALAVAGEMAIGAKKIVAEQQPEAQRPPAARAPDAGTFTPPAAAAVRQEQQPQKGPAPAPPAGAFGDF